MLDPDLATSSRWLAILIPFTIQFLVGNFIEPLLCVCSLAITTRCTHEVHGGSALRKKRRVRCPTHRRRRFGSRLAIHPITVLFALVLWNLLWGIMGGQCSNGLAHVFLYSCKCVASCRQARAVARQVSYRCRL